MLVPTRNPPHSNFKFSTGIWLFMVVLLLAACDTLSSRQCKTVDWRKLGLMDALSGRPITRIKLHAEACKKVEIEPDLTAWSKGYELGRDHYCQPKNAYDVGRGGNTYLGICIPEQHAVFVHTVTKVQATI